LLFGEAVTAGEGVLITPLTAPEGAHGAGDDDYFAGWDGREGREPLN